MLKSIFQTFIYVVAGITISAAFFIIIFSKDYMIPYYLLLQIVGMSGICALGNLIFYAKKELTKKHMALRIMLHYLYINVIVLGGAFLWNWIRPRLSIQVGVMVILIAAVYTTVTIIMFQQEKLTASDLNKRLRKFSSIEDGEINKK